MVLVGRDGFPICSLDNGFAAEAAAGGADAIGAVAAGAAGCLMSIEQADKRKPRTITRSGKHFTRIEIIPALR
jgi:hypothetical protein